MTGGVQIGYAAMLEQRHPLTAIELAVQAEAHGFTGTMATDHFQPWLPTHGHSPFVWNVLTALGERTRSDFGPGMAVPGYRYHPATVAQASATLAAMYEGRHWLGIGSGEALNEHVVGGYWPEPAERINRMFEAVDLIRRLFSSSHAGNDMRFSGDYFQLETTRLWTMPQTPPPILVTTGGPVTARRAGRHADGLITVAAPYDHTARLLERFATGARDAGRDPDDMTRIAQLHLSWAPTQEQAARNAVNQWPIGAMKFAKGDVRSPVVFEQIAKTVRAEDFDNRLLISADLDEHHAHIQKYIDLGFDRLYLHNAGPNQLEWIETFGHDVLPQLRGTTGPPSRPSAR